MAELVGELLKQKRDNFRVELRRKATEQLFKSKRQLLGNNNENQFTDEKVNQWYNNLVNKQNIPETLAEIREALRGMSFEYNLQLIHKHEVYPLLLNFWNQQELDYKIIQELLFIFANLHSFNVFDDLALLQNQNFVQRMIDLLQITVYKEIQQSIFFLLSNLVACDNGKKARILANYQFCSLLKNMWINHLIYLDSANIKEFCWFLNNFFDLKSSNVEGFSLAEIKMVLPIVLECLHIQDDAIQQYSLSTLQKMCLKEEVQISLLKKNFIIIEELQKIGNKSLNEQIQLKVVEIIAGFGLLDDEYTILLVMKHNILDYLLSIYIQPGRKIEQNFKKVILWGLNNLICIRDFETLKKIINHDILKFILKDESQSDIIQDILQIIVSLSQIKYSDLLKYILMSRNIVDIVMNQLKLKLSKKHVLLCLNIIYNFCLTIGKDSQSEINMAIEMFNSKGFDDVMKKLEYDMDDDISNNILMIQEAFIL